MRFGRFGLKQHWIVECKCWNRRVPKEKVHTLKDITEDLGADRGILIAERGHQSGAHEVATLTNITLTTLAELREAAKGELLALGLSGVRRRAVVIQHDVRSLTDVHEDRSFKWLKTTSAKPGADLIVLSLTSATAHDVESGANDTERGAFPICLRCFFDEEQSALNEGGWIGFT